MLFGSVALVGLLGVSVNNLVIGPATTVNKVTQQNMAQNDLLMNAKVIVMHASTLPLMGDGDGDGYVEPVPFVPTSEISCNITLPGEGGCLPQDIGAILTDPWGSQYAYCVWDHGDPASSANRIDGEDSTSGAVLAIISAGPNKRFETPCLPYDGDPETNDIAIDPRGVGDDLVQIYTYAAAVAGSGGLWELKDGEPTTAVIDKKLEIGDVAGGTGFAFDTGTGTGEFPYVKADYLASKSGGGTPVEFMDNIALAGKWLSGDGQDEGLYVDANGNVGIALGKTYQIDGHDFIGLGTGENSTRLGLEAEADGLGTIAIGYQAGKNATGTVRTVLGGQAGLESTGEGQTVVGVSAGAYNTAEYQSALGYRAGMQNTGESQSAFGYQAGYQNTGSSQTAMGRRSGYRNAGNYQTAFGYDSGYNNTGVTQTVFGATAGYYNTGTYQGAFGYQAGLRNTGNHQTAAGTSAGYQNTGLYQSALGYRAGYKNEGGNQSAFGYWAGYQNTGSSQTALGFRSGAHNTGNYVIAIGSMAGEENTGNNLVAIGDRAGFQNSLDNQFIVKQYTVNSTPLIQGNFATGRVGIGRSDPANTLHVAGVVRTDDRFISRPPIDKNAQDRALFFGILPDSVNTANGWDAGDIALGLGGGANSGTNTLRILGDQSRRLNVQVFNGDLSVRIGKVNAPQYCDQTGANCITSAGLGNLSDIGDLSCSAGQIIKWHSSDGWVCAGDNSGGGSGGDNLGDHTATQDLDLADNAIINLSDPTDPQSAATKAYVDMRVPLCPASDTLISSGTEWVCSSDAYSDCALDGVTVAHGEARAFYLFEEHTDCAGNSLSRSCDNGALSGSASYQYANCEALPVPACETGPVGTPCPDGSKYAGSVGGVRFYAAANDESISPSWNNGTSNFTETGATSTYDGKANTDILVGLSDAGAPYTAAAGCRWKGEDWYLPSKDELNVMYTNRVAIGGFNTGGTYYWSSSEYDNYYAWVQGFSDGDQAGYYKVTNRLVRCVRR